jgi:hypothetical protein
MMDGSQWEDLIKSNLVFLKKFEFYKRSSHFKREEDTTQSVHSLSVDLLSKSHLKYHIPDEDIYLQIIRLVDQSKLRHLQIHVTNIRHVEMLLETFTNLFSIRFRLRSEGAFIYPGEVITSVKTLMPSCSILRGSASVSIWMDQRVEMTNDRKRLKVSHEDEDV